MIFTGVCVLMFLLLLFCVVIQYNDPDPIRWMLIYGYGAVLTALAVFGKYSILSGIGSICYLLGFFYMLPKAKLERFSALFTDIRMDEAGVEEAREAGGLLICAVWMAVLAYFWYRGA